MFIRRGEWGRFIDAAGECIGHDLAALAEADEDDTAFGAAGGDVVLDFLFGVVDACCDLPQYQRVCTGGAEMNDLPRKRKGTV